MDEIIKFISKTTGAGSSKTLYVHIDRNIVQRFDIDKGDILELALIKIHKGGNIAKR